MRCCAFICLIMATLATSFAQPQDIDARFDVRDAAAFAELIASDAKIERLASGMQFTEGPVWMPQDGGYLIFSDIPADELKRWSRQDGLSTFRKPSHNTNGNARDMLGRLISCEHGSRSVTCTEREGDVRTLASSYQGRKLNSPNDLACRSDGTIWFTDPPYGIGRDQQEQPKNFVFRLDPKSGDLKAVADDFDRPNGLCFSPDEKKLYVADSGKPRHIRVFELSDDAQSLGGGKVFCTIDKGVPDGIRCDEAGNVWSSAGDGVQIFSPDGKLIGKILLPETPANLCFGGADGKTLFITAQKSLYALPLKTAGATTKPTP